MTHEDCIKLCLECATDCEVCLDKMLDIYMRGDSACCSPAEEHAHSECPRCCRECLEVCLMCAQAMARESRWSQAICKLCADICKWCADECAKHSHDHCQKCAESCRKCAEACREMAAV